MIDLYVDVVFENLTVVSGSTDGVFTPVDSFILVGDDSFGWSYSIDLNGEFVWDYIGTTIGSTSKSLVDRNGFKWNFSPDETGPLIPERDDTGNAGPRTFWLLLDPNDTVYVIGVDITGGFDKYYLS